MPKSSLINIFKFSVDYIYEAEMMWIIEAQKLLKTGLDRGDYKRLGPRFRNDSAVIVGGRLKK